MERGHFIRKIESEYVIGFDSCEPWWDDFCDEARGVDGGVADISIEEFLNILKRHRVSKKAPIMELLTKLQANGDSYARFEIY